MTERFGGPLAALWPGLSPTVLGEVLRAPDAALPVPSASDRATWDRRSGSVDPELLEQIITQAEADLGQPWPAIHASHHARFFRDGERDSYEQLVFARQRRLSRAAVAAAATLELTWLDEVIDGAILLCEQSNWCWPAHDDSFAARGFVLPNPDRPFLDLGAAEVVGQLAWVDHLLGPQLDQRAPGVRARLRHEARVRVFEPFQQRRHWRWLGLNGRVNNWNPWIHSQVIVAALQLLDPSPKRNQVLYLAIEGLDRYVATLPSDGAVDEGYSYWWNGAGRALEALQILRHASHGHLDASSIPALRATVAFPYRMQLGGEWYLNIGDGQARPDTEHAWHALFHAAVEAGDSHARAHAAAHRRQPDDSPERRGLGRLLRALSDPEWVQVAVQEPPLPAEVWLPSVQVLIAREQSGSAAGLTLAVKAGHNDERHNHNDVGSFVVALNGVPVIVDAGRPTYTAGTFGPDRYRLWLMQSSWHNVPEIRRTPQSPGLEYRAVGVQQTSDATTSQLSMDLAAAYPRDDIRQWRRTTRLDRRHHRVTIEDDWQLRDDCAAPPSTIHLLLAGTVTQTGPRSLRVAALQDAGAVDIECSTGSVALQVRELDDPLLTQVWGAHLTRVVITLDNEPAGHCTVTIA